MSGCSPLHWLLHYRDREGCSGHVVGHCPLEVSPPVLSMDASSDGQRPEPRNPARDCTLNVGVLKDQDCKNSSSVKCEGQGFFHYMFFGILLKVLKTTWEKVKLVT